MNDQPIGHFHPYSCTIQFSREVTSAIRLRDSRPLQGAGRRHSFTIYWDQLHPHGLLVKVQADTEDRVLRGVRLVRGLVEDRMFRGAD